MICDILSEIWQLEVLYESRVTAKSAQVGALHTPPSTRNEPHCGRARGPGNQQPHRPQTRLACALFKTSDEAVQVAPTYLLCIFTSSLTAIVPWFTNWGSQIISTLARGQAAMANDYPRMQVMRALHKAVHCMFVALLRTLYEPCPWWHTVCVRARIQSNAKGARMYMCALPAAHLV